MLQRFLDPAVLAGISGLDLIAKTVVDGFVAGLHRSPDFGFSQEFAEYRAYTPGDDLRHVDWNVFARTERAYLKRYRGETNSLLTVLLDASNSMKYTSHAITKMDYARYHRRVPLLSRHQRPARCRRARSSSTTKCATTSARPRARASWRACSVASSSPSRTRAPTSPSRLQHFQEFLRRRGLVLIVSDFYESPENIVRTIEPLRFHGNEVVLFHVLDPKEVALDLREPAILVDLETQESLEVTPDYAKNEYRQKMDAHIADLRERAQAAGMDYYLLVTDRPLDGALREYLTIRQGRD